MKTKTIEGTGVVIWNEECDYLSLDDINTPSTLGRIFEAAGSENVHSHLEHALLGIDGKHYDEKFAGRSNKDDVEAYRAESGRQYPQVYRIKVSVELEELPDDECEAFWVRHQYPKCDETSDE